MSYIRLANFFKVFSINKQGNEVVEHLYHNSSPGQTLTYQRVTYQYLSFIYQGAAKNRTGDNLEAQLVMSANAISNGFCAEAVRNKFHIQVNSAVLKSNGSVDRILTQENWLAASLSYDNETVEIILSSAIDAVGASAPTRVLTRDRVGHLPVTGNIQAL